MSRTFTDDEMETLKRMSDWMNVHAETLRSFAEEAGVACHCGYQLGHDGPCQEDE